MAKNKNEAAIEQLNFQAQELRDVIKECDDALAAATRPTSNVLISIENADIGDEAVEYFVPNQYVMDSVIEGFKKWREDTCLRLLAVTQKLEGLA